MHDFSFSLNHYVNLIFFFCAPIIIGIIFWKKQRTKEILIFALGITLMWLRGLIITVVSLMGTFMHNQENDLSLIWLGIGAVVYSIGLIITLVGYGLVIWKMKKNT
jgi:hypothetical protein